MRDLSPSRATKATAGPGVAQPSRDANHLAAGRRHGPINLGIFFEGVSFADLPREEHHGTRSPKAATKLQIKIESGGPTRGSYFGTHPSVWLSWP